MDSTTSCWNDSYDRDSPLSRGIALTHAGVYKGVVAVFTAVKDFVPSSPSVRRSWPPGATGGHLLPRRSTSPTWGRPPDPQETRAPEPRGCRPMEEPSRVWKVVETTRSLRLSTFGRPLGCPRFRPSLPGGHHPMRTSASITEKSKTLTPS